MMVRQGEIGSVERSAQALNPLTHGRAVELVASGALSLEPLITHRLSLSEVPALLLAPPQAGEVKAMMVVS